MGTENGAITLEIFGSTYVVRGDYDRERLVRLAARVDDTMRTIAAQSRSDDPVRLAVLAALNLADELERLERQQEGERAEVLERVAGSTGELAEALDGRG